VKSLSVSPARAELLAWVAGLGAVSADALARRLSVTVASARSLLSAAARDGQLVRHRPLAGAQALYTVTRAGLRAAAIEGLQPCRVSPSCAQHLIVCAWVAAALEHRYSDAEVIGEPVLRLRERNSGAPFASAVLAWDGARGKLLHRPDLALVPSGEERLPVAIEVELTVKAPRRLAEICRAWARSRHVEGVVYLAPPTVQRAVERAVVAAHAEDSVVVIPLDSLAK
jgi:hypothetical protein